jgi:farnesyl diphosphate synthase
MDQIVPQNPPPVSSASFEHRLTEVAGIVEVTLDRLLGAPALSGEIVRPARLLEAMRYASLDGGKRLRPFLAMETARALGSTNPAIARVGAAIEMIHCYSLVHDDLPAMDDDDLRRGRPTVHKAYDEATGVLAGDGLLTLAFDVLADPATHEDACVRADLVLGLARASGIGGMVGGQALDLEAEKARAPLGLDDVRRLQAMKTGALLKFSVEAGAIFAGAPKAQRDALVDYGKALGAAFQVADDLLDATGDEAAMGKRIGKDADRHKATLISALGLDGARKALTQLVVDAEAHLGRAGLGPEADVLREAAHFVAFRTH